MEKEKNWRKRVEKGGNDEEVEGGENQGEERGRGNGIKDEEGKIKAKSLLFLGLTKENILP